VESELALKVPEIPADAAATDVTLPGVASALQEARSWSSLFVSGSMTSALCLPWPGALEARSLPGLCPTPRRPRGTQMIDLGEAEAVRPPDF